MQQMIRLKINGKDIQAPAGTTVLEAARQEGIFIPTLCHHEALEPEGTCRLCVVEVSGSLRHGIRTSCIQEVKEGLVVETDTERLRKDRQILLEMLLGRSPYSRSLLDLAAKCGVMTSRFLTGEDSDCVRCGRCVRICRDRIGAYALCWVNRGAKRTIATDFERLSEYCIGCGACAQVCPTDAIRIEDRGNERKIFTWGQMVARFKLEPCKICGKPLAPKKYFDYISEKTYKPKGLKLVDAVCPECERKAAASPTVRKSYGRSRLMKDWRISI
ncbi:MAG: 2Fe-2S iron-sulfur cluster-binding protein [Desulfobacteraceae bacterium]